MDFSSRAASSGTAPWRRRAGCPVLTLTQALSRGENLALVVRKATELGVQRILPVSTARAVPRLEAIRSGSRRERWEKIAREAARQSGRADVPEVRPITSF